MQLVYRGHLVSGSDLFLMNSVIRAVARATVAGSISSTRVAPFVFPGLRLGLEAATAVGRGLRQLVSLKADEGLVLTCSDELATVAFFVSLASMEIWFVVSGKRRIVCMLL
jgi:hypothetical protein